MQLLARFVRGRTAIGMFKRFLKDTLVSGCATLCVSMALSSITKTVVPLPTPRPEAARAVPVEQVQPLRESAQSAVFVPADQTRSVTSVAVGTGSPDAARAAAMPADAPAAKERPRRTAASQPASQFVPASRAAEPVRIVHAVAVQPLPAPVVSAPLDGTAVARPPAEERAGGRFGAIRAAVSFLRQSGEVAITTASEVKDRVWGATGGALSSVLR